MSEQQLLHDLSRFRESSAFTELEKLVLDLAVAMTRNSFERPRGALPRPSAPLLTIADRGSCLGIAQENFRCSLRIGPSMLAPQPDSEGAFCPLPAV